MRPRPAFPEGGTVRLHGLTWSGGGFAGLSPDGTTVLWLDGEGRPDRSLPAPRRLVPGCVAADAVSGRVLTLAEDSAEILAVDLEGGVTTLGHLPEEAHHPVALAWDGVRSRLLLLDSGARKVWSVGGGVPSSPLLLPDSIREPAGLAVDGRGHLLVGDRVRRRLVELGPGGRVRQAYDLGRIDPGAGLTLGPSRDGTDAPERESLYTVQDGPTPRILESMFDPTAPPAMDAAATGVPGSLVNAFATSGWTPASPDPTGLAYRTSTGTLLVSDSEVDEMNLFDGVNLWESTPTGAVVDACDLTTFTVEATGVAYDGVRGRWFLSDDDARRIFEVLPGPDGRPGTADDTLTSIRTNDFGATDPEGVAYDEVGDRLFVSDGVNGEVYIVTPGPNGQFDGVPPRGDDLVSSFDTDGMGLGDTEGIEYNPDAGTLFIVSRTGSVVAETTPTGVLIRMIDVSSLALNNPSGLAYGPGSNEPSLKHLYIADRGVDNDDDPRENDGKIVEATLVEEPGTLESRVSGSADDAEEKASGTVALRSPDLEMAYDGESQTVGMRFTGIRLPRGADVAEAWVQFRSNEGENAATVLAIRAQADDDAPMFTSATFNLSSRPVTAALAPWGPPQWLHAGDQGMAQRTSDLSAVLEEVLSRPGWIPGNAVVLLVTGEGRRSAKAWDLAPTSAPLLHVRLATTCGDGVKGPGEECDGTDLGGTTCAAQGCGGGTPVCTSTCTLDFSGCGVRPESCNGLDDDCDGAVDNAPPPADSPLLTVAPGPEGTILAWSADPLATGYDVVDGPLEVLRDTGDLSQATCLGDDLPETSAIDPVDPPTGGGRWYLVRPVGCGGVGTYDDADPAPLLPRDPAIGLSPAACP